jgi:hypothetical protein
MYRRPKFLETLLEIRREMAREADYDVDLFAEMARSGTRPLVDAKGPNGHSGAVDDVDKVDADGQSRS